MDRGLSCKILFSTNQSLVLYVASFCVSALVSIVVCVKCHTQGQRLCYITVHYIAADHIFHDFDYFCKNISEIRSECKYLVLQLETIMEQIQIYAKQREYHFKSNMILAKILNDQHFQCLHLKH